MLYPLPIQFCKNSIRTSDNTNAPGRLRTKAHHEVKKSKNLVDIEPPRPPHEPLLPLVPPTVLGQPVPDKNLTLTITFHYVRINHRINPTQQNQSSLQSNCQ